MLLVVRASGNQRKSLFNLSDVAYLDSHSTNSLQYLLGIILVPYIGFRVYCTIAGLAFFFWGIIWSRGIDALLEATRHPGVLDSNA